jgi:hypothetical protein
MAKTKTAKKQPEKKVKKNNSKTNSKSLGLVDSVKNFFKGKDGKRNRNIALGVSAFVVIIGLFGFFGYNFINDDGRTASANCDQGFTYVSSSNTCEKTEVVNKVCADGSVTPDASGNCAGGQTSVTSTGPASFTQRTIAKGTFGNGCNTTLAGYSPIATITPCRAYLNSNNQGQDGSVLYVKSEFASLFTQRTIAKGTFGNGCNTTLAGYSPIATITPCRAYLNSNNQGQDGSVLYVKSEFASLFTQRTIAKGTFGNGCNTTLAGYSPIATITPCRAYLNSNNQGQDGSVLYVKSDGELTATSTNTSTTPAICPTPTTYTNVPFTSLNATQCTRTISLAATGGNNNGGNSGYNNCEYGESNYGDNNCSNNDGGGFTGNPGDATDQDGDGIPDYADADIDGDCGVITNASQYNNQSCLNGNDTNGDGIIDGLEDADYDGQGGYDPSTGTPTNCTNNGNTDNGCVIDDNGVPYDVADIDPNIDNDGYPNATDPDIDGDGINNIWDTDTDGDGYLNVNDNDDDNDGVVDGSDSTPTGGGTPGDIDGDGIPNELDADIDGDCGPVNGNTSIYTSIGNCLNGNDTDGDGIIDGLDNATPTDDGGYTGGTPDNCTQGTAGCVIDSDGNPYTDGSGNTDIDPDTDNDGLDNNETGENDMDGDGVDNGTDIDSDGDGYLNDGNTDGNGNGSNDGSNSDTNDDNDNLNDTGNTPGDGSGDGNNQNADGNGNDSTPQGPGTTVDDNGGNNPTPGDIDGDGILNYMDADIDGDCGGTSVIQGNANNYVDGCLNGNDTDGDGIIDGLDNVNSDGSGGHDGGTPDNCTQGTAGCVIDSDGVPYDVNDIDPDIDDDGINNQSDPDMDGDGVLNVDDTDTDGDGYLNDDDNDDDNDGILDVNDTTPQGPGSGGSGGIACSLELPCVLLPEYQTFSPDAASRAVYGEEDLSYKVNGTSSGANAYQDLIQDGAECRISLRDYTVATTAIEASFEQYLSSMRAINGSNLATGDSNNDGVDDYAAIVYDKTNGCEFSLPAGEQSIALWQLQTIVVNPNNTAFRSDPGYFFRYGAIGTTDISVSF